MVGNNKLIHLSVVEYLKAPYLMSSARAFVVYSKSIIVEIAIKRSIK